MVLAELSWTMAFIIQQIVTLSKYGHDPLDICHP